MSAAHQCVRESTQEWYEDYYARKGKDRNDLRHNPGVLFQALALEASIVRASRAVDHDPETALVLDVGCGGGGNVHDLLRLNYRPDRITGIDILPDRIAQARRLYPQARFIQGDARRMEFANHTFDLVFESTMFATLPDDALSAEIASEMLRVCKPGGYLMLVDWRTPKPWDASYKALTRRRLAGLFAVPDQTEVVRVCRGALVPPLGRCLSQWLPGAYFTVAALFPFLVGQVAFVLRKRSAGHGLRVLPETTFGERDDSLAKAA
jgi:SAM-dependent methyltransferase